MNKWFRVLLKYLNSPQVGSKTGSRTFLVGVAGVPRIEHAQEEGKLLT
jgi:hypothetical protein